MMYTLRFFFSSKCSLFHNFNVFGSCIIHILYTGCAKIKKKYFRRQKVKNKYTSKQPLQKCVHGFPGGTAECTLGTTAVGDSAGHIGNCAAEMHFGLSSRVSGFMSSSAASSTLVFAPFCHHRSFCTDFIEPQDLRRTLC